MNDPGASSVDADPLPPVLRAMAEHWGLVLAYGLITLVLGVVLLVWPDASLAVLAVLLAIQLVVAGLVRIVRALSTDREDVGVRALVGLAGGLALIVGLLILRDPLQSVLVLGMVLGAFWLIAGVVDILGALVGVEQEARGWGLLSGVLSILFGGFLIVDTDLSVKVLVVLVGVWLVVAGVLGSLTALRLRSARIDTW